MLKNSAAQQCISAFQQPISAMVRSTVKTARMKKDAVRGPAFSTSVNQTISDGHLVWQIPPQLSFFYFYLHFYCRIYLGFISTFRMLLC